MMRGDETCGTLEFIDETRSLKSSKGDDVFISSGIILLVTTHRVRLSEGCNGVIFFICGNKGRDQTFNDSSTILF